MRLQHLSLSPANPATFPVRRWSSVLVLCVAAMLFGVAARSACGQAAPAAIVAPASAPFPAEPQADPAAARRARDRVLARPEFTQVKTPSWLDRMTARLGFWLQRIFGGLGSLALAGPWVGRILQIVVYGGALTALAFFLRRTLQRQRLAVALNHRGEELEWTREATDWAAQAEASARDGLWRDAIHCLYWAAIVLLESRRAWRHNPARTPREYVRLLKPGSAQQGALRGLTQLFERLWYGLREAGPGDYEKALNLYQRLRDQAAATEPA